MELLLSDEQAAAALAGSQHAWSWVPAFLPEGRQQLPPWLKGLHINWMEDYGNAPYVSIKVEGDVFSWPGQAWQAKERGLHITEHPDGRARAYYHRGAVSKKALWRICNKGRFYTYKWQVENSAEAARAAADANIAKIIEIGPSDLRGKHDNADTLTAWIKPSVDTTTQENGFGGDRYLLQMVDGSERLLCGPWHGSPPKGYVEVTAYDRDNAYSKMEMYANRPWHRRSGTAGLLITEDLFLRAVATYAPHVRCAYVNESYGVRLEPYRAEWDCPKGIWQAKQP